MVSSSQVTTQKGELEDMVSNYGNHTNSLKGQWEGQSYEKFISEAENFVNDCKKISTGMDAFASACETYKTYLYNKETEAERESRASGTNDESLKQTYKKKAEKFRKAKEKCAEQIRAYLETAKSTKIDPPKGGISFSSASAVAGDNLMVSANCGYVFPIEKGVYAPVTSSCGPRSAPTVGASTNHKGTDIGVGIGTKVHSLYSGTVVATGYYGGYGNRVVIQQDDGRTATYAHLSKSNFYNVGDKVNAGDVVALTGNTGVSTGPHLHLEIHDKDGSVLNSENLFSDNNKWPGTV